MSQIPSSAPVLARARQDRARRGSAVLVVMILLACLALFIMANASALHTLKQELKLIEQQQLKKYGDGGGAKK